MVDSSAKCLDGKSQSTDCVSALKSIEFGSNLGFKTQGSSESLDQDFWLEHSPDDYRDTHLTDRIISQDTRLSDVRQTDGFRSDGRYISIQINK